MLSEIVLLSLAVGMIGPGNVPDRDVGQGSREESWEEESKNLNERRAVSEEFFDDANLVVQKSGDRDAEAIVALLRMDGYLVQPKQDELLALEYFRHKLNPVGLLLYLRPDLELFPDLKKLVEREGIVASYVEEPPLIKMFQIPMSRTWRGLFFITEGWRARTRMSEPKEKESDKLLMLREIRRLKYEGRLLAELGGGEYRGLLEKEIHRIKQLEDSQKSAPGQMYLVYPAEYNPAFERMFGEAQSPAEKKLRQLHFYIQAEFTLIERRYAKEGEARISIEKARWYYVMWEHRFEFQ